MLGLELLAWLDEVDAPLATLRADTFEIEIDGRMFAYVSGGVTELQDEVYIVAAGEEMPLFIATPVPEPSSALVLGAVGMSLLRRRRDARPRL